jgi:hypothetical protein
MRMPAWSPRSGPRCPAPGWQRCRTHYAANLMAATPKASRPWVRALLHSVYDQPDATSVHAQFDRVLDALADKLPKVAEHLEAARAEGWPQRLPQRGLAPDLVRQPPASGSTGRSAGAPRWSASSPTATPRSASRRRRTPRPSVSIGRRCRRRSDPPQLARGSSSRTRPPREISARRQGRVSLDSSCTSTPRHPEHLACRGRSLTSGAGDGPRGGIWAAHQRVAAALDLWTS